jgi:2-methylcitrate dehydratase PrpD
VGTVARAFADWACTLRPEDVPAPVRERVVLRVADAVGLVAAAWETPPGRAVRAVARDMGAGAPGTASAGLLFDDLPLHPAAEALAHGTLVHTLDYDDTLPASVIHPSSVLVPAAFAAADDERPGADVVTAVAAGDELLARLGAAAGRGLHAQGFQATGIFGPLAAALVVGRMRGRSPDVITAAMGLAGSMSGGILEFLSDGTWSKRLHPGWAAHGGVVADGLAARSFPGPASVVEGRHGLFAAFLHSEVDAGRVLAGLGTDWASTSAEIKLYPCAHVLHPFIEMAAGLYESGVRAGSVEEIECEVAPWYVPIVGEPRAEKLDPVGEYQARTSLYLAVALALTDGDVGASSFEPDSVGRHEVRALARRVRYREDPNLSEGFAGRLHVVTQDGRRHGAHPRKTDVARRVADKFLAAVAGPRPRPETERAARALWSVASTFDTRVCGELRGAARAAAQEWEA